MKIEFEITLRCNTSCVGCSRHCPYGIYDESSDVTVEQTGRFIREVQQHPDIDMVSIMGGEPTLHPQFEQIVAMLREHLLMQRKIRRLQVVSNGLIPVNGALGVGVCLSPPEKAERHRCQLVAPLDTGQALKECRVQAECGISFGAYGYWPCGAGGAIARLFGLIQYNRRHLPVCEDEFAALAPLCVLCQAKAQTYMMCSEFGDIRSISFRRAFRAFDIGKLRRY